jgi:uncharacterized membrane protein YkoI
MLSPLFQALGVNVLSQALKRSADIHRAVPKQACMMLPGVVSALVIYSLASAFAGDEEPPRGCVSKIEQRDMLARREVIPLADAIRAARPQQIGDVLRAQLCRGPEGGFAYVLTLLPRNGKVTRVLIDASNGNVISGG